jgi:hypothetical protein
VAVLKGGANHWIDADQIDAPRVIRNAQDQIVWRWNSEAFGSTPAEENPSGLGAFEFNPRLPGQVFDRETGLHYNDQRDWGGMCSRIPSASREGPIRMHMCVRHRRCAPIRSGCFREKFPKRTAKYLGKSPVS